MVILNDLMSFKIIVKLNLIAQYTKEKNCIKNTYRNHLTNVQTLNKKYILSYEAL